MSEEAKTAVAARKGFHLGYHRGLDGLRGVAIAVVLLAHGAVLKEDDGYGFVAVNTFFVLSGFLITCLLVEEWDARGDISLRRFYLRRALRLLPALVAMLAVFLVFAFLTDPHKRAIRETFEALRALFYSTNWARIYHIGRNVSLLHTWSLSIEEQFYLLWPMMLLFALRRTARQSLLCWISLGIFLSLLTRIALKTVGGENLSGNIFPISQERLYMGLDTRADALLCGCFGGVAMASGLLPKAGWFQSGLKAAAIISVIGLLMLLKHWFMAPWMIFGGWLAASVFAAILIVSVVSNPGSLLAKILEFPPLVYTGKISYGLYVWHFPILLALKGHGWPWEHLIYLIWVVPTALASYYLVERPFLRRKRHYSGETKPRAADQTPQTAPQVTS